LTDFAGDYEEPSFGRITFTMTDHGLVYRWGALSGPVEVFDATKTQLRIEVAGSGNVVGFTFANEEPAQTAVWQGVTFRRVP
jgi:hypothetical protein